MLMLEQLVRRGLGLDDSWVYKYLDNRGLRSPSYPCREQQVDVLTMIMLFLCELNF